MEKTFKKIGELHEWGRNSRIINTDEFEKLRDQITLLGQYKPLIVMPDGTVLGGNMRLKAYQELNVENVWVSIVDFIQEDALWYAIVNGERQSKPFTSQLQGMTEYALSDNEHSGYYDEDALSGLLSEADIELDAFNVDIDTPVTIQDLLDKDEKPKSEKQIICPSCGHKFTK